MLLICQGEFVWGGWGHCEDSENPSSRLSKPLYQEVNWTECRSRVKQEMGLWTVMDVYIRQFGQSFHCSPFFYSKISLSNHLEVPFQPVTAGVSWSLLFSDQSVLNVVHMLCVCTWKGYLFWQGMIPPEFLTISAHLMRLSSIEPLRNFFCRRKNHVNVAIFVNMTSTTHWDIQLPIVLLNHIKFCFVLSAAYQCISV